MRTRLGFPGARLRPALLWVAWLVLSHTEAIPAADYHVDAVAGDDTAGDGSELRPWRTVTHALRSVTGTGHVVHVRPGTYDAALGEALTIRLPPGVILQGEERDNCILRGRYFSTVPWEAYGPDSGFENLTFENDFNISFYHCGGNAGAPNSFDLFVKNCRFRGGRAIGASDFKEFCIARPRILHNIFELGVGIEIHPTGKGTVEALIVGNIFAAPPALRGNGLDLAAIDQSNLRAVVSENLFVDNSTPVLLGGFSGSSYDVLLERNRIIGPEGNDGIGVLSPSFESGEATLTMVNNTIWRMDRAVDINTDATSTQRVTLVNNTIADYSEGVLLNDAGSSMEVRNTIIWGGAQPRPWTNGTVNVLYSDIQTGAPGPGNLDLDPMFQDLATGILGLLPGSPCIDAGTSDLAPDSDIRYTPRQDDPATPDTGGGTMPWYEIGAHEYVPGDSDADTYPDPLDCAPLDPDAWSPPAEVELLLVSGRIPRLGWTPVGGSNLPLYEVATGTVSLLRVEAFASAACLGSFEGLLARDARTGPGTGQAWWYLVRARNACGVGTFGDSSLVPDPRDDLDAAFPPAPCP